MSDPRLTAYVLGELQGQELKDVEAMIGGSPALRSEVEKIRRMTGQLRAELGTPAPPVSTAGMWRGLLAIVLGLGVIAAVAQFVLWPAEPKTEDSKRLAMVLLDPPVAANQELTANNKWSVRAPKEDVRITVGMDAEGIYQVVNGGLEGLSNCYGAHRGSGHSSVQQFAWTVNAAGQGTAPEASGGPADSVFSECLLRSLRAWRFPTGQAGQVRMSFLLHNGQ